MLYRKTLASVIGATMLVAGSSTSATAGAIAFSSLRIENFALYFAIPDGGGGFTKDWLYVAELERIFRHWATGGDMDRLLLGKVTNDALDDIQDLVGRGVLRPAAYLPAYLDQISGQRADDAVQNLVRRDRVPLGDLLSLDLR